MNKENTMRKMIVFLVTAALVFGCATVTHYPDGRVVEERPDPAFLGAFTQMGMAALEIIAARQSADGDDARPTDGLAGDLARVRALESEVREILAGDIGPDEEARLTEIYAESAEILRRWGVRVKVIERG